VAQPSKQAPFGFASGRRFSLHRFPEMQRVYRGFERKKRRWIKQNKSILFYFYQARNAGFVRDDGEKRRDFIPSQKFGRVDFSFDTI